MGIALVLVFFIATRLAEASGPGNVALTAMDRVTAPLWNRADDFMRSVIAGFFIAVFAVGGVYLTPDLKTPAEWVSWTQLLIAVFVFWRRTMPRAAIGIIGLWVLALRDYDVFHLLDYLALGVGVAGYLVLAASDSEDWRRHRFEVLRWAVATALPRCECRGTYFYCKGKISWPKGSSGVVGKRRNRSRRRQSLLLALRSFRPFKPG